MSVFEDKHLYEDSLSMDTGGESEHALKLRKAQKAKLDDYSAFADSQATNYGEWRENRPVRLKTVLVAILGVLLFAGLSWLLWTMVDAGLAGIK